VAAHVVQRVLARYVKTAGGKDFSSLSVQLTDGVLVLRELDLNVEGAQEGLRLCGSSFLTAPTRVPGRSACARCHGVSSPRICG
jgi:hypothetical protein